MYLGMQVSCLSSCLLLAGQLGKQEGAETANKLNITLYLHKSNVHSGTDYIRDPIRTYTSINLGT